MNPYEPIFTELANRLLEVAEIKPNYSDSALMDVTIIFQSVFMDNIFENQNYDKMDFRERLKMVDAAGRDLHKLIHTYTGIDMHKLAENV